LVFEHLSESQTLKDIQLAVSQRKRLARTVSLDTKATVCLKEVDRSVEFLYDEKCIRKVFGPNWRMLLIGGGQLSRYVAQFEAVVEHASDHHSVVLALTHDSNLDDAALIEALPSNACYVGALGSKANNARRRKRLADIGVDNVERLHGPVGLAIGSRSSAEIAVSIVAELVQLRNTSDRTNRTD